jgi:hypothetical protein
MACLMAEAPVQVQKTCSCSCSACVSRDEAAACCHPPHGQVVPCFMGHPWPPAPTTPCWSRRHQTSFQLLSHWSLHTWRTRAWSAFVIASAMGRGPSCGWVRVARVIADSAHYWQASILAVWLGCMHEEICRCTHCQGGRAEAEWTWCWL